MFSARYEIHQEQSDAANDAWTLVFDLGKRAWAVEHMWRRKDPKSRQTVSIGKERHSVRDFEATRKGKRLSEHLRAALAKASSKSETSSLPA